MKIGGFVKQSLIDYPGKIAAVIFTQGCNFRCGYCHNPQLVLPELFQNFPEYNSEYILKYLQERKKWLEGVVVTGGEPTIHKDLPEFLKEIKNMGYLIKLDTNGSNSDMLEHITNNKLADYVAMDLKTLPELDYYNKITGIYSAEIIKNVLSSVMLLRNSDVIKEFRTTRLSDIHNEFIINKIRDIIGKNSHYEINEFRESKTIHSFLNQTNSFYSR